MEKLYKGSVLLPTTNEREPMTHEIVRNVKTLTARLAKHKDGNERAKVERTGNETELLDAVLVAMPVELFGPLGCAQIQIADTAAGSLSLIHRASGVCYALNGAEGKPEFASTARVHSLFTLEEVIGGLVAALAERIDKKHEHGRKLTRVNRKLRGILSILDNS